MILRLALDLPEDKSFVRTTRLLNRTLMEDIKVVKNDIDDVEAITTELCTNVLRHAELKGAHYSVVIEYYKPRVVIVVTDRGPGFVSSDVAAVGSRREDFDGKERFGGYGMPILEELCDVLEFTTTDPHGTTVRAEKMLSYETPADAIASTERDESGSTLSCTAT